jgi:hypothetical protein
MVFDHDATHGREPFKDSLSFPTPFVFLQGDPDSRIPFTTMVLVHHHYCGYLDPIAALTRATLTSQFLFLKLYFPHL